MKNGKVILKPKREHSVEHRHPWIFSGAIQTAPADAARGETVGVCDAKGTCLGYGSWSPDSQIRVRMLSFDPDRIPDEDWMRARVAAAVSRRAALLNGGETDACRLIHAESDGLPGVIADVYGTTVVVQLATAGAERWKETLVSALMETVPGCTGVWNRSDVEARRREGLDGQTGLLTGVEPPELIPIHEGEIRYLVDVRRGHKTGFYLDQRLARAAVARYAAGADVLNCFSYTGGFGLAAQAAGARTVTNLDASADALALARRNSALTPNPAGTACEFLEADVFRQLRRYRDEERTFDLIVLDPPKFAESKAQLNRAARGYKDINVLAMKLLKKGGILATFSCSGAMTEDLCVKMLSDAAFDSKCDMHIIERTMQAADHPVSLSFPEGLYLKGYILSKSN